MEPVFSNPKTDSIHFYYHILIIVRIAVDFLNTYFYLFGWVRC